MTKDYHHLCSAAHLPLPGLGDDDACHRSMTTFQPRVSSRFTGSSPCFLVRHHLVKREERLGRLGVETVPGIRRLQQELRVG
jgi:hypothetical protein